MTKEKFELAIPIVSKIRENEQELRKITEFINQSEPNTKIKLDSRWVFTIPTQILRNQLLIKKNELEVEIQNYKNQLSNL